MNVAESIGQSLAELGLTRVFGVVGSGNFHVTNALVASGARYVAARHECGATTMADAYARMSGQVAAVTLHQGCGLTNAMTGITEAAKSRTPLLILAAEATNRQSNFFVDQHSLATAVGAHSLRLGSPETAVADAIHAYELARDQHRTVVLNLPLDVQNAPAPGADELGDGHGHGHGHGHGANVSAAVTTTSAARAGSPTSSESAASPPDVTALADLLAAAQRPVIIAGRGARHARAELLDLAEACGALLATSAVARGMFAGSPWSLDVSGGFATPTVAELVSDADVIAAFGCSLNMWTTRHGTLFGPDTAVAQVDIDPGAIGRHHPVGHRLVGDAARIAEATARQLWDRSDVTRGYRSEDVQHRLQQGLRWRDVPYEDWSSGSAENARIDPRTLTIALDDLLPAQRVVSVDSGNFMGYPSMYLAVPDEYGFCFTQAFQSVGLGLATAIGAALAQPDRLPVAALGDGGALMAAAEFETVHRLGLPMLAIVYNDDAYGAEVHHFAGGEPLDTITFPETDIAAVAAGYGWQAATVRHRADLESVRTWLEGPPRQPLLLDAKVASPRGAWWLEEAFRGH
ncbi:thiamine pyrophosphate-binding protein [Actinobacteria bacterium YIM 96077]|uniref:Thiamine pyrophosphate-binding protein n=1 Tax=Phytoactinopolyspora halophila TaxID=1981511 RepID=A0A329QW53_9ACTN|nr:thiamine pyrophosphate-binding protein [Phytoactinopolyspora halophila]AYY12719.1 thiamine pyrophosphate-binding protein [Actinobacteria bacterium YIM 96077]RAW16487.1 thiamine pyrophosphate-binding protein [Phytoactinopolyspora halophila]